jgi:hypothetical protein
MNLGIKILRKFDIIKNYMIFQLTNNTSKKYISLNKIIFKQNKIYLQNKTFKWNNL